MKTKHTLLFVVALLPLLAQGQYLQNYTATSEQGEWQSIAATGTLLASVTGDYGNQTLALPFDFQFGQSDYPQGTTITVRADGFVVMRGSSGNHNAINYWSQSSSSIISPFMLFDGQMPAGTSGCWWQLTEDDDGNQMLVIEWQHVQHYPAYPISSTEASQDNFNYQLRLHSNGDISAVYGAMHNGVTTDTLFNFILVDGATTWQNEYSPGYFATEVDHVALRGTWDSLIVSTLQPAYRSGNNWVITPSLNLAGVPDSGTVVTWHRPLPPCPRPTSIAVTAVAHDTALLSWVPNEVDGSFVRIQYDTVNFTPGGTGHNLQLYGGDTMHLTGLVPNHHYWLYMRSDCGEDSSEWFGVQFTTPCAPLSHSELPLSEDFESLPPDGYTSLWGGCSGTTVYVKDMAVFEGRPNQALRGDNSGWFHLPPVDSVRTTVLRFKGHGPFSGSSRVTLQVGVMDDPFDINSLQVLQTFTVNQNAWEEYTVPMATYTGTGNTVALKWTAFNWFFLDDIVLEVYDGCLPVESVDAIEIGQHSALIGWSNYVPTDSNRVVWYPAGQAWLADSVTTAADSVLLTGLDAATDYVVGVRALCSDSSASEPVTTTFRTRCAVPLPLYEDFDAIMALPDCWNATSIATVPSTGSYTPAVPELIGQGENHVVKFSSQYNNYYNYERGILLLPFVDTVVNRLRLTFDYRVERFPQLMSLMVGVIPGDDDIEHFIPVATIEPTDTLWHTYTVETGAVPIAEGRLVLMQHSTASHEYVQGYWRDLGYVDNVFLEVLPSCDRPAAVWVTHITATTAEVHWLENNGLGTYVVNYNGADHLVSGDSTLLLTGLTPANYYTVGVSRLCEGMYTNYRTASFTTACQPIDQLPWHEDFEMWTVGQIDYCWLRYQDPHEGSEVKTIGSNYYTTTDMGSRMLQMEAANYAFDEQPYDALAVLPEIGVGLEGMAIGLRVASLFSQPANLLLELGLMDDGGDSTSFHPIDTIPVASTWEYYEHAFAPADSGRLALRLKAVSSGGRLMIDDMGIFPATGCLRPSALTVDTVTQHTARLVVSDTAAVGSYRYYWRPYASHADAVDSVDATGDTMTLTNLTPGTYYVASVAARCTDSTLSNIVYTEFYTDCDTILHADLPHVETFNSGSLSHCWSLLPAGTYAMLDPTYRHGTSGYSLILDNSYNSSPTYAVLPVVDTLAGLDLTFKVYAYTTFHQPGITVGVMSDPTDTATFVAIESFDVSTGWTEHQVSLGPYSTLGHHIALRPDRGDSTSFVTIYVDDVTLSESLPCERPDSVRVDSIGSNSVVLTIADAAGNRHYLITATSPQHTTTLVADFDSNDNVYQVVLTGLMTATEYTVTVSSICYNDAITFPVSVQLVTACAPLPLPWRQDFEAERVNKTPRCWEATQGVGIITGSSLSSTQALHTRIDDGEQWMNLVTPELAFGDDSVRIVFYTIAQQGYTDSNHHYNYLDTRLQLYASLDDSLILLYDDSIAYSDNWQLVNLHAAPLPYGARLLFRPWRTTGCTSSPVLSLDELSVQALAPAPNCDSIADLAASDIGFTSATISWTPQGSEQHWELYLRGDGTNVTTIVDSNSVTFTDLAHSTTFICLVRALCNDTLTGPWSDTLRFTTAACEPVTDIQVSGITSTTATVRWQHAEGQSRWLLNYGPADFPQGEGVMVEVDSVASITLEGLTPETTYDIYVRALCDEGHQSGWSLRTSFSTATTGITLVADSPRLTVYPNPCGETVNIKADDERLISAVLTDMQGRRQEVRLIHNGPGLYWLDLKGFPQATYLLTLTTDKGEQKTVRLVKIDDN
ncbi:MAG: fibronectin type III domain-containing protein [Bacteroidales bacterium]|nr:fibronectin type III domain-containing protein [Bacteroidales bacterium]